METIELITKKKNKQALTEEEINFLVTNYTNGTIPDYQMSAFLMAVVCQGMTVEETIAFTKVMLESGEKMDLSAIQGVVVDKHSTGGVGDKMSLILGPLVASCGLKVAKMSGRGLGYTGGTIDKLESIKGFQTHLTKEQFFDQVNEIGIAIVSQTENLVPADKKIYALRDVTGTTESIPLIASSIMSKKIASGASKIVIDVKVGRGALMKTLEEAKELAHIMVKIGAHFQREVVCVLTNMEEPLGYAIGNGLEVKEAIDVLQKKGPEDLTELVRVLGTKMVALGKEISLEQAEQEIDQALLSGRAYQTFESWIQAQQGDLNEIRIDPDVISLKSPTSGIVTKIDAEMLGELAKRLGAGRTKKEDSIDYGVGFVLEKKVGDFVLEDETLMRLYYNGSSVTLGECLACFKIEEHALPAIPLILDVITHD